MESHKYTSIVIVNWNTLELLDLCIRSIFRNLSNIKYYQIIVVDNGSTDDSVKMLEELYPEVEIIKNHENIGFGAAVNQAQLLCKGEYILLLNSDAQLLDDGVKSLINILNNDRRIGVITGLMQNEKNLSSPSYYSFPKYGQLLKSYSLDLVKKVGSGTRGQDRGVSRSIVGFDVIDVDWVSGGYMLLRNAALGGQPIFDHRIFMYFEDTLLCRRLWAKGYRASFSPIAPVLHAQGGSGKKIRKKTIKYSFESSRIYIREVYGERAILIYNIIISSLWRMFSLVFGLFSLFGSKKCREKTDLFNYLLCKAFK